MYGPVRTVVWQGSAGDRRPYADTIDLMPSLQGAANGHLTKRATAIKRLIPKVDLDSRGLVTLVTHRSLECAMPSDLQALVFQAEQCAPPDSAPALLRLARGWSVHDRSEAERLLDRGLSLLSQLSDDDRLAMAPHSVCLTACVVPDRAFSFGKTIDSADRTDSLLLHMAAHGHAAVAVDYVTRWSYEVIAQIGA